MIDCQDRSTSSITMAPENLPGTCAACQNPAKKFCSGCKDHPTPHGLIGSIWYCSADCQKAHWKAHKKDCKFRQDRLTLFRSGGILQEIFYIYRETMFDKIIVRTEEKDGRLYLFEGVYPDEKTTIDFLKPFPTALPKSQQDKHAILTMLSCSDALGWMHEIVAYLLSSMYPFQSV